MAKLSTDIGTTRLLHPRENLYADGALASVNAEVIVDADGSGSVALDLRGTFSLTIEVAGTVDGTNWTPIPMRPVNQASKVYVATIVGTTAGLWVGAAAQYRRVRARVTAYTSGSCTTRLMANVPLLDQSLDGLITPTFVTQTAAAAAICTLTLAAPGAGLRQYVTHLSIEKFATALLTAAAAPVIVTSTGLTGTPSFNFSAGAEAQGTLVARDFQFPLPAAASAQNASVTFVGPATTAIIWRITAGYYIAP